MKGLNIHIIEVKKKEASASFSEEDYSTSDSEDEDEKSSTINTMQRSITKNHMSNIAWACRSIIIKKSDYDEYLKNNQD